MTVSVTNWIVSLTMWLFTYKISSCTISRNLPSNVWWLYHWQTELYPLPCDILQIQFLLVLHLETCQAMSLSVTNWIISLTLWLFTYKISSCTTSRNLPSNVWWLYHWQTELSPLPCDILHIKFLLVLHLETCQAMSDDCISDKLNYLPWIEIGKFKLVAQTRFLIKNIYMLNCLLDKSLVETKI